MLSYGTGTVCLIRLGKAFHQRGTECPMAQGHNLSPTYRLRLCQQTLFRIYHNTMTPLACYTIMVDVITTYDYTALCA